MEYAIQFGFLFLPKNELFQVMHFWKLGRGAAEAVAKSRKSNLSAPLGRYNAMFSHEILAIRVEGRFIM